MEPRGCLGDYDAAEDRYTLYTGTQRAHRPRRAVAPRAHECPESQLRIVAGDVGGSFGMKGGALSRSTRWCCWAAKQDRPAGQMDRRAQRGLPVATTTARDNVTDAELALDKDGNFLALRVAHRRQYRRLSAAGPHCLSTGNTRHASPASIRSRRSMSRSPRVFTNTNPMRPYRGAGRPEAAYVIERLIDRAARELGIDPAELRRRNYDPARRHAVQDRRSSTPTTAASSRRAWTWRCELADWHGLRARAARERARRGKLRGIGLVQHHRAGGGGRLRSRGDPASTPTGTRHADRGQRHATARATRPSTSRSCATGSASTPDDMRYVQGDTDQVFLGERHRRLALRRRSAASAVDMAADEDHRPRRKQLAAHLLEVDRRRYRLRRRRVPSRRHRPYADDQGGGQAAIEPTKLPKGMDVGLTATATYHRAGARTSPTAAISARSRSIRTPAPWRSCATSSSTTSAPSSTRCCSKGQIIGGVAQGVGQALIEDIQSTTTTGQLLTGSFMDYAMPRADDISAFEIKSNPVPTKTNPLGVKGAGEAGCVGALPAVAECAGRCAVATSASAMSTCRRRRSGCGA